MFVIIFLRSLLIFFIILYKNFLSPFLPTSCRFYPTCSSYAFEAIKKYNLFFASILIIVRVLKCNPFFKGGYDPL